MADSGKQKAIQERARHIGTLVSAYGEARAQAAMFAEQARAATDSKEAERLTRVSEDWLNKAIRAHRLITSNVINSLHHFAR